MREMILNGLLDILWCIWNWFISLVELPLSVSPAYIVGTLIACVILFASAAWAGNIAENKGHYPHLHILLALILPFIYPLIIHFTMKAVEGSSDAVTKDNQKKRERATALREAQWQQSNRQLPNSCSKRKPTRHSGAKAAWNALHSKRMVQQQVHSSVHCPMDRNSVFSLFRGFRTTLQCLNWKVQSPEKPVR